MVIPNLMKLGLRPLRRPKHHTRPGAAPGTLFVPPDAPETQIRVIAYGPDELKEESPETVPEIVALRSRFPVVWVDVRGLRALDTIRDLGEAFGLHVLALEDLVHAHQRPKVDVYDEFDLIITRMGRRVNGGLDLEQVGVVVGDGFVLTFQEHEGDCLDPVRDRLRRHTGRVRDHGPDFLAWALMDAIVDNYFPVLERYGDALEDLEADILRDPDEEVAARLVGIRHDLLSMRRAIWPLRDAMATLRREGSPRFQSETLVFLRDLEDHVLQLVELFETFRETGASLMDLYTTMIGHRMNEVMKVLTIIATIFMPMSFIAGVYGMNFERSVSRFNMPELGWDFGYFFALALMGGIAVAMLLWFRRKRWL
ncbi:MAG: magnesium/cobalt transporter CorA [Myxococcota bacterium]